MEKYNGCSVPQYTAYPRVAFSHVEINGRSLIGIDWVAYGANRYWNTFHSEVIEYEYLQR